MYTYYIQTIPRRPESVSPVLFFPVPSFPLVETTPEKPVRKSTPLMNEMMGNYLSLQFSESVHAISAPPPGEYVHQSDRLVHLAVTH